MNLRFCNVLKQNDTCHSMFRLLSIQASPMALWKLQNENKILHFCSSFISSLAARVAWAELP